MVRVGERELRGSMAAGWYILHNQELLLDVGFANSGSMVSRGCGFKMEKKSCECR